MPSAWMLCNQNWLCSGVDHFPEHKSEYRIKNMRKVASHDGGASVQSSDVFISPGHDVATALFSSVPFWAFASTWHCRHPDSQSECSEIQMSGPFSAEEVRYYANGSFAKVPRRWLTCLIPCRQSNTQISTTILSTEKFQKFFLLSTQQ
jgi:hypothetical protein